MSGLRKIPDHLDLARVHLDAIYPHNMTQEGQLRLEPITLLRFHVQPVLAQQAKHSPQVFHMLCMRLAEHGQIIYVHACKGSEPPENAIHGILEH